MAHPPSKPSRAVAEYIRVIGSGSELLPNKEIVLIVIGEKESGKSSLIRALISPEGNAGGSVDADEGAPEAVAAFVPWQAHRDLTFQILDVAGHAVYSMTHQLFLMRRAVYLFVWRVRK